MNTSEPSLRVLHVTSGLQLGGTERVLQRLVERLPEHGVESRVLSLRGPGPIGHVLLQSGTPVLSLSELRGLRRAVWKWRPAVIQGWMYHGNLAAWLLGRLAPQGTRVVWNIRAALLPFSQFKTSTRLAIRVGAALSAQTSMVLYNSRLSMAQHETFGYARTRSRWIPNGFDTHHFHPVKDARPSVRVELGLPQDAPLVGLVARFDPVKNHRGFLEAFRRLSADIPQARAVFIGTGMERTNCELRQWIAEAGVSDKTLLLGPREDLPRLLSALDLLVSASLAEGFPNCVGEAMSCGTPCIGTDVGDTTELLGTSGMSIPSGDVGRLCHAIGQTLDLPLEARQTLGMTGRERILQHYSVESMVTEYARLYRSIADSL